MKVIVKSALMQPEIIELFENLGDANITYKYEDKKGINLTFAVETTMSATEAAAFTKSTIKAQPGFAALYFAVEAI